MFVYVHFSLDGKKTVRLSITLDVILPSHTNFHVTKTFETTKEKLTATVRCILNNDYHNVILIAFVSVCVCAFAIIDVPSWFISDC